MFLIGCGGPKEPVRPQVGSNALPVEQLDPTIEPPVEDEPLLEDPPDHPWGGDSLAKLPKVDFVVPYAKTRDPAKTKQAAAVLAEAATVQQLGAALAIDPGHVEARYALAKAYVQQGANDRALALLLELRRAACESCMDAINRARWEVGWEPLWDRVAFSRLGYRSLPSAENVTCPAGSTPDATDPDFVTCTRGGALDGPYKRTGFGADWGGHGSGEEVGSYRNSKKHGLSRLSNSNGATEVYSMELGGYVDDQKHGLWVLTDDSRAGGSVVYEKWVRGKREGIARRRTYTKAFLEEQRTQSDGELGEETYVADVLEGPTRTWLGTQLIREGAHRNGKKQGKWTTYAAGKPIDETEFEGGEKHGAWTLRSPDGVVTYKGSWDRGRPVGTHEYFHAGKRVGVATIKDFSGDWVAYRDNVRIEKGRLAAAKREGKWSFYQGGEWYEGSYTAGRRTGTWKTFDGERVRIAEGPYVADQRDGAWTYWRDTKVRAKGRFTKGVIDGAWTVFGDSDPQKLTFKAGTLVEVNGEAPTEGHRANFKPTYFADFPEVLEAEEIPSMF